MAYIESFFLYVAAVLFMFAVLFGGAVVLYMLVGQMKLFYSIGGMTWEKEKKLLFKLIKSRFFKFLTFAYLVAFVFFYVNESINYYGKGSAYPKAKSYAIVGDFVYFWHSVGINIHVKTGFQEYARFINPEGYLDRKIQNFQSFLLSRMYQYIPKDDGEREFWYYKYKQLYMVKIRYHPESAANPNPRFSKIMDKMFDTSYKLYDKSFKDKNINNQRYVFIGQMSYYLSNNIAYYATYNNKISYLKKLFIFMDNKELFQKNIRYAHLLYGVYKKYKRDKNVKKEFDETPYNLGLFYAGILVTYDMYITYNAHNNINPCTSKEIKIFVGIVEDFYNWEFRDKNSSFHKLSKREQDQVKWLYEDAALSYSYGVATYLCEIPLKYKDDVKFNKFDSYTRLPLYKNKREFKDVTFTLEEFTKFSKLEKLLEQKERKNKKSIKKDK